MEKRRAIDKDGLPPEMEQVIDYMSGQFVKRPLKLVQALGLALQLASKELAEVPGEKRNDAQITAALLERTGELLLSYDRGAMEGTIFAMGVVDAMASLALSTKTEREPTDKED